MTDKLVRTAFINPLKANLCYVNSVSSCLINMSSMVNELENCESIPDFVDIILHLKNARDTIKLRDAVSSRVFPLNPNKYKEGKPEDAAEFLGYVISCILQDVPSIRGG